MMSNGYKPTPLDLSDVKLNPGQEVLVDKLAENAHNVWAKDRIKQGWTYGIQQVRLSNLNAKYCKGLALELVVSVAPAIFNP